MINNDHKEETEEDSPGLFWSHLQMNTLFLCLSSVSQHALAVLMQACEGMESVLLPLQYSGMLPDVPSVVWRRSDVNSTVIHLLKDKSEEHRYSERTSMKTNALDSGDFSLTLRNPQLSDSSNYTCSIQWDTKWEGTKELRLTRVQLQVKDDQEEVEVQVGAESIQLPCKASADLPENTTVEWTHFDPQLMVVHVYRNKTDDLKTQDRFYCGRTEMNKDMTLTLKYPRDRDSGMYICTVYKEGDVLRSKVMLQLVKGGFPTWAIVLLVLVFLAVLMLIILLGVLYLGYFLSVYKVEVDSGKEFVLLPCKTTAHLTKNFRHIRVEWSKSCNTLLYVYGSSQPDEQDENYRNRIEMSKHPLKTGDFSLKLKHPTDGDTSTYTCTVCNKDKILRKKQVVLLVKVKKVDVVSGEEFVQLPLEPTFQIKDLSQVTVEWTDNHARKVHVCEEGSDKTNEQDNVYKKRTEMNKDPLGTGGLSLTLKQTENQLSKIYTCTVYNRDKEILMRKQVKLEVKDQQVEVEEGAKSALLPFSTTTDLPRDARVVWRYYPSDFQSIDVYVYEKSSAQLGQLHKRYRNRTKMSEDPWTTGDFSLTLNDLQHDDYGRYVCKIIRDGVTLRRKLLFLRVKGQ